MPPPQGLKRKYSNKSKNEEKLSNIPDEEELNYLEKVILGTGPDAYQQVDSEEESEDEILEKRKKDQDSKPREPAWVDEDDDVTFGEAIRKQKNNFNPGSNAFKNHQSVAEQKFQKVMGVPKWSKLKPNKTTPADELLKRCGPLLDKPKYLEKGSLEIKKLKNLNFETNAEGKFVNVVKFHPKSTIAMVAGASGLVSLFQVDGKQNTKLQSIKFQNYPIFCGAFLKNGEEFLIGSQFYKYFYSHNLITGQSIKVDTAKVSEITKTKSFCVSPCDNLIAVCGNNGRILLFSAISKEYICSLQMNCNVRALDFSNDGSKLYSHGEDGEVYIWDVNSRTCIKKFFDDGCLTGTSVTISKSDQLIACGSSSGIVNVYNSDSVYSEGLLMPTKTIYNLVTPITGLRFNSSSELLAISSKHRDNSVRIVHCSSMTVFDNFPAFHNKIVKPLSIDFSPNSGYFAIGDSKGNAHLYRLKHYGSY